MSSGHTKKPIFDNADTPNRKKISSPISSFNGRNIDLRNSMIKKTEMELLSSSKIQSPFKGYESANGNSNIYNLLSYESEQAGFIKEFHNSSEFVRKTDSSASTAEAISLIIPEIRREVQELFMSFIKSDYGQTLRDITAIKEKLVYHQNKIEKNEKNVLDFNLNLKKVLESHDSMLLNFKQATRNQFESFAQEMKIDLSQKNENLEKEVQRLTESCVFLSDKVDETIASTNFINQSISGGFPEDNNKLISDVKQKCEENRVLNKCLIESIKTEMNNKFSAVEKEIQGKIFELQSDGIKMKECLQRIEANRGDVPISSSKKSDLERKIKELENGFEIIKIRLEEKNKYMEENMETIKKKMNELPAVTTVKKNQENVEAVDSMWQNQNLVTDSNEYFDKKAPFSKNFTINFQDSVSKIPKKLNQNAILGDDELIVSQEINYDLYQKLNEKFAYEEKNHVEEKVQSPPNDNWLLKYQEEMQKGLIDFEMLKRDSIENKPASDLILPDKKSLTHHRSTTPHSYGRYEKHTDMYTDSLEMPQIKKFESNDGRDVVMMDDSFNIEDRFLVKFPEESRNRDSDFKKFTEEIDEEQSKKALLNNKNEYLDDSVNIGHKEKDMEEEEDLEYHYQIDEDWNLMDKEGNLLVDEKGKTIKLNEDQINFLRLSNTIREEN